MPAPTTRIPAVCITVTRATGPTHLCGKSRLFTSLDCWRLAEGELNGNSWDHTDEFGEDAKHDFRIVFADGFVYNGTIVCRDGGRNTDVRAHVGAQLSFAAGVRPAHLTEDDFALYQSMISAAKRTEARRVLDTYDI